MIAINQIDHPPLYSFLYRSGKNWVILNISSSFSTLTKHYWLLAFVPGHCQKLYFLILFRMITVSAPHFSVCFRSNQLYKHFLLSSKSIWDFFFCSFAIICNCQTDPSVGCKTNLQIQCQGFSNSRIPSASFLLHGKIRGMLAINTWIIYDIWNFEILRQMHRCTIDKTLHSCFKPKTQVLNLPTFSKMYQQN